jgi:hypothetical protein
LDNFGAAFKTQKALLSEAASVANRQETKMTIALDHAHDVSLFSRLLRALRIHLAAFHYFWFIEGVAFAEDPLASLSPRDWSDLPTWHPKSEHE